MLLEGKVAVVTGASRGLGKAMAIELAKEGASVAIVARTLEAGQSSLPGTIRETVDEIARRGGRAIPIQCDVTREADIDSLFAEVNKQYGRVDILINNAGINTPESFLTLSKKKWDLVMSVNLDSMFMCCKAALPQMVDRKGGNIINVSSVLARRIQYSIVYGTTKAAIERFTQGLAKEMKKYNISVNALCPDFTVTEAVRTFLSDVDTKDWQRPEMWGRYAARVASSDARTLTGLILDEPTLKKMFGGVE